MESNRPIIFDGEQLRQYGLRLLALKSATIGYAFKKGIPVHEGEEIFSVCVEKCLVFLLNGKITDVENLEKHYWKIVFFQCLSFFKKTNKAKKEIPLSTQFEEAIPDESTELINQKKEEETKATILKTYLDNMDGICPIVLRKKYHLGQSIQEIAEEHGWSDNYTRLVLFRCRYKIKEAMKEKGFKIITKKKKQ